MSATEYGMRACGWLHRGGMDVTAMAICLYRAPIIAEWVISLPSFMQLCSEAATLDAHVCVVASLTEMFVNSDPSPLHKSFCWTAKITREHTVEASVESLLLSSTWKQNIGQGFLRAKWSLASADLPKPWCRNAWKRVRHAGNEL